MTVTADRPIDGPPPATDLLSEVAPGDRPLRILTFASVFPNVAEPWRGSVARDRTRAIARIAAVEVMAPVQWLPRALDLSRRNTQSRRAPPLDSLQGVTVHYPRVLALPRVLKTAQPALLVLACAPALVALRRRFRFDLLHAGSAWPDGVAAAALAALIGVPLAVSVGGDDINVFEQHPIRRPLIRWALRRAALVITHSQKLQRRVAVLGVRESRMAVIPDGVDLERFRPLDREATRACLGIPSSTRLLVTVGRLHRPNGLATLMDALGRLAHHDPELRLVILGNPDPGQEAMPEIRAAIARSGLQGRVTVVGGRSPEELAWWYSAADVVCLATGHDSSHPLLEAMACGVPCVTMDVAGRQEMVAEEPFGMLTGTDSASLAQAIDRALQRQWDREGIARHARSRGWGVVGREWRARFAAIGAR